MVDAADRDKVEASRNELHNLLDKPQLQGIPVSLLPPKPLFFFFFFYWFMISAAASCVGSATESVGGFTCNLFSGSGSRQQKGSSQCFR